MANLKSLAEQAAQSTEAEARAKKAAREEIKRLMLDAKQAHRAFVEHRKNPAATDDERLEFDLEDKRLCKVAASAHAAYEAALDAYLKSEGVLK